MAPQVVDHVFGTIGEWAPVVQNDVFSALTKLAARAVVGEPSPFRGGQIGVFERLGLVGAGSRRIQGQQRSSVVIGGQSIRLGVDFLAGAPLDGIQNRASLVIDALGHDFTVPERRLVRRRVDKVVGLRYVGRRCCRSGRSTRDRYHIAQGLFDALGSIQWRTGREVLSTAIHSSVPQIVHGRRVVRCWSWPIANRTGTGLPGAARGPGDNLGEIPAGSGQVIFAVRHQPIDAQAHRVGVHVLGVVVVARIGRNVVFGVRPRSA